MPENRDFQVSKVYRSEREHSAWIEVEPWDKPNSEVKLRLMSLDECRNYVGRINRSRWFKSRYNGRGRPPGYKIKVEHQPGTSWARGSYGKGWINLPAWARQELVILHELAHAMLMSGRIAPHGCTFCRLYLDLIKRWMGQEAWAEMKICFKNGGVKVQSKADRWQ